MARNRIPHYQYRWATFFIDWLRKPNLKVEVLKNDPSVPAKGKMSVVGKPPFEIKEFLITNVGSCETQHESQFYFAWFKAADEPLEVLNGARLRLKFGVLKIANLPRKLCENRIREGKATGLTADLSVMPLEGVQGVILGEMREWTDPKQIVWYRDDWNGSFKATQGGKAYTDAINNLREVEKDPLHLLNAYLRQGGSTYDLLPPNRTAYLWLFFTDAAMPAVFWTLSGFQGSIPGKYKLKVGITGNETFEEHCYELEIKTWLDFEIRAIEDN